MIDSVEITTDTTLDQDSVLKANVQVCTACMIVSLMTTCLNLNTPPLAQVAPFRCKIRESNAEMPLDTKLSKHVCQLWSVQLNVSKPGQLHLDHSRASKRSRRLVNKHSMVPTKRLLSVSSTRILGLLRVLRQSSHLSSVSSQFFLLFVAFAFTLALLTAVMIRSS